MSYKGFNVALTMRANRALYCIQQADLHMLVWCGRSRAYPHFMRLVRSISRTGDGYAQVAVPLVAWAMLPQLDTLFLQAVALAFTLERALYLVLKNTLRRQRPPAVIPDFTSLVKASDKFSFPSGHTMAAFLLAGLMTSHLGLVALPLYGWAAAVGTSRVLLGVHFPSDIIAGATIGSAIALLIGHSG